MMKMNLADAMSYSAGMATLSAQKGETTSAAVKNWPHGVAKLLRRISALSAEEQAKLLATKVSWPEEGLHRYEERAFMSGYAVVKAAWKFNEFEAYGLNNRLEKFPCADRMLEGLAEAKLS